MSQPIATGNVDRPLAGKTHDYTRYERGLGHDVAIRRVEDGGKRLRACGWGRGIVPGDFLLLDNGEATTRYAVVQITYMRDPSDQWFAELAFSPREPIATGKEPA